jgi:hypothetical protein
MSAAEARAIYIDYRVYQKYVLVDVTGICYLVSGHWVRNYTVL